MSVSLQACIAQGVAEMRAIHAYIEWQGRFAEANCKVQTAAAAPHPLCSGTSRWTAIEQHAPGDSFCGYPSATHIWESNSTPAEQHKLRSYSPTPWTAPSSATEMNERNADRLTWSMVPGRRPPRIMSAAMPSAFSGGTPSSAPSSWGGQRRQQEAER